MGKIESIFPISNRLKEPLRNSFNQSIFHDGKVVMDDRTGQKKLRMEVDGMSVPFITWSAGQKEFMPLLLGFYWLCPPSKISKKGDRCKTQVKFFNSLSRQKLIDFRRSFYIFRINFLV